MNRLAFILAALFAVTWTSKAKAHDWMTAEQRWCCSNADCLPYPREKIKRVADGWYVPEFDHLFKDGDPRLYNNPRPDLAEVFMCKPSYEKKPRCLMILPEGS